MTIKLTNNSLRPFYNIVLAWMPILSIYKSFIPGISIGELFLVMCTMLSMILGNKKLHIISLSEQVLCVFVFYSLFITIIYSHIGTWFQLNWVNRVIRFSFYIFCVLYLSKLFFDIDIFMRNMNWLFLLLFLGIVFQYAVYYGTGRYFRLYGNIMPLRTERLLEVNYDSIFLYSAFRPSSFLTEPSHIAQTAIIPFSFNLYMVNELKQKKHLFLALIIGLTVFLSKSLWGIFLIGLVLFLWLIDSLKEKHDSRWYIIVPFVLIIGGYFTITSTLWADAFLRLDLFNIQNSIAFTGRFYGYEDYLQLPFYRQVLGSGFGAVIQKQITNSVLFILIGEGAVGILLVIIMMFSIYKGINKKWKRALCLAFCILLFGSNIFFSISIILMFSLYFDKSEYNR